MTKRRTEQKVECPVTGCSTLHDHKKVMCRHHWLSVPKGLRDELWRLARELGVQSAEYAGQLAACIATAERNG